MHYRLCELQRVDGSLVGERGKIFFQEIEIEPDIVSDDDGIFSKKSLYLRQNSLSCRRGLQVGDGESGDESDDMLQFIRLFVRLDQRLIFANDFSGHINLYDPYLDGFILGII